MWITTNWKMLKEMGIPDHLTYPGASLVAQLVKNLLAVQETPVRFLVWKIPWRIGYLFQYSWASLVAQKVNNLPAMQGTCVGSLGWKDPLEK